MLARSIELRIADVQISLVGDLTSATVTASQTITYDWRRAGPPPQTQSKIVWTVFKTPSGWRIGSAPCRDSRHNSRAGVALAFYSTLHRVGTLSCHLCSGPDPRYQQDQPSAWSRL